MMQRTTLNCACADERNSSLSLASSRNLRDQEHGGIGSACSIERGSNWQLQAAYGVIETVDNINVCD